MVKNLEINPSILSADFSRLGDQLRDVEAAGIRMLHVDVMDRHFVPNLTFGPFVLEAIRKAGVSCDFDVHLMVDPVDALIEDFIQVGATRISFHPDATHDLHHSMQLVKSAGCQLGIALNPDQDWDRIKPFISEIDFILLMTVYPGFSGQAFIESVKPKITACRAYLDQVHPRCRIQLDGGVSVTNIRELYDLGADHVVMGSAFFAESDFKAYIQRCQIALDSA
ncbi:MAG: ribulose-phosphate 3-epimerase [bacterium]